MRRQRKEKRRAARKLSKTAEDEYLFEVEEAVRNPAIVPRVTQSASEIVDPEFDFKDHDGGTGKFMSLVLPPSAPKNVRGMGPSLSDIGVSNPPVSRTYAPPLSPMKTAKILERDAPIVEIDDGPMMEILPHEPLVMDGLDSIFM